MKFSLDHCRDVIWIPMVAWLALSAAGCSSRPKNFAKSVTGKVTLGGQPLAGASIAFTPVEGGSPSMGRTDANGNYTLLWVRSGSHNIQGAQIGEHTVAISTFVEGLPTAKPPRPEVPEKVPYAYRAQAKLTATVKKGSNTINFDLEPGPVEPPPPPKSKTKGKIKGL